MTAKTTTPKVQKAPKIVPVKPAVSHRLFEGEVMGISGNKTIRVQVAMSRENAKYRKQFVTTKRFLVHDEKGVAAVGNRVSFEECRPLSKMKRWRLISVIS